MRDEIEAATNVANHFLDRKEAVPIFAIRSIVALGGYKLSHNSEAVDEDGFYMIDADREFELAENARKWFGGYEPTFGGSHFHAASCVRWASSTHALSVRVRRTRALRSYQHPAFVTQDG
jgi:hypothetical protein